MTMMMICWKPVSSQDVTIPGFLGENATLPCIFGRPLPEEGDVFWTDQSNDRTVLHIKQNQPDFSSQDKKYEGRVSSSVEDYKTGNFSITIMRLQLNDADTYECTILPGQFQEKVILKVSDKRVGPTPAPRSGGAARANVLPVALILAPSLLLCFRSFRHI